LTNENAMQMNQLPPAVEMDPFSLDMSPASLALVLGSVAFAAASLQRRGLMRGLVATLAVACLLCAWLMEAVVMSVARVRWTNRDHARHLARARSVTSSAS
jgi:hypothetical protein